jgi:hypothetical protein
VKLVDNVKPITIQVTLTTIELGLIVQGKNITAGKFYVGPDQDIPVEVKVKSKP